MHSLPSQAITRNRDAITSTADWLEPVESSQSSPDLSHIALRNIFLFITTGVFLATAIDWSSDGSHLPSEASIGRGIAGLLCLGASLLAHFKKRTLGFCFFSMAHLVLLTNATFIAGFGIYSPAMMSGVVPIMLAFVLFETRKAVFLAAPTVLMWLLVSIVHVAHSVPIDLITLPAHALFQPKAMASAPTPTAWLLGQIVISVPAIALTLSNRRRSNRLLLEERMIHAQTRQMLEDQKRWSDERDEFMGRVSHELRTPLAAMRNALTLACHPKASDTMRSKSLNTLDTSIGNLTELLNDVLDAFKYGSAGFSLREMSFSSSALLGEIAALYSDLAEQKGLRFSIESETAGIDTLHGDPTRLKQMLSNLISNAIKFTDSGQISVRLTLKNADAYIWRFEVRDTGPGIKEEDQEKLFKPFAQVQNDKSDSRQSIKGTGLGLSIVSQLAQAMGGRAGLSSQIGQGSTFYFEVPLLCDPSPNKTLA